MCWFMKRERVEGGDTVVPVTCVLADSPGLPGTSQHPTD